jgi:hypothetical protein
MRDPRRFPDGFFGARQRLLSRSRARLLPIAPAPESSTLASDSPCDHRARFAGDRCGRQPMRSPGKVCLLPVRATAHAITGRGSPGFLRRARTHPAYPPSSARVKPDRIRTNRSPLNGWTLTLTERHPPLARTLDVRLRVTTIPGEQPSCASMRRYRISGRARCESDKPRGRRCCVRFGMQIACCEGDVLRVLFCRWIIRSETREWGEQCEADGTRWQQ